ncbi:MAG: ABC transporter permease [Lachnospiraceae bacterium]|nr:ABC transporter permease [Lachnospiraceae bacterium]
MKKLIWLEWKKNRIGRYIRNALVLAVLLALFLYAMAFFGIANDPETGIPDAAPGMLSISASTEFLTNSAYFVFTGVMLASFVVNAYKNGIMALMFTYPLSRKKILCSQMASVWIFNFVALVITKLLVYTCLFWGGKIHTASAFPLDFHMESMSFYGSVFFTAAVVTTIGFLSLFAGLFTKSSKVAVITSFLLIFLTQGSLGDKSLAGNTTVLLILAAISLALAVGNIAAAKKQEIF